MDNPVDNLFIYFSDKLCPYFRVTNHSPNIITTYSFLLGLLSVYYLFFDNVFMFSFLYLLSYFFDCVDGHYARKYGMVTSFGDKYDHFTDVFVAVILSYVVYSKFYDYISFGVIICLYFSVFMMLIHLGHQQQYYHDINCGVYDSGDDGDEFLDNFRVLCVNKNDIYFTRYFGTGSFMVFTICLVFYLHVVSRV